MEKSEGVRNQSLGGNQQHRDESERMRSVCACVSVWMLRRVSEPDKTYEVNGTK